MQNDHFYSTFHSLNFVELEGDRLERGCSSCAFSVYGRVSLCLSMHVSTAEQIAAVDAREYGCTCRSERISPATKHHSKRVTRVSSEEASQPQALKESVADENEEDSLPAGTRKKLKLLPKSTKGT